MRDVFSQKTLNEYNRQIKKLLDENDKINYIEVLLASDESKLSIVARPNSAYVGEYKYFGAHPCISEKLILDFFKRKSVCDASSFWKLIWRIQKNLRAEFIPDGEKAFNLLNPTKEGVTISPVDLEHFFKYKIEDYPDFNSYDEILEFMLLGRVILRMASRFAFSFHFKNNDKSLFEDIMHSISSFWQKAANDAYPLDMANIAYKVDENRYVISFQGFWPGELLNELSQKCHVEKDGKILYLVPGSIEKSNGNQFVLYDLYCTNKETESYLDAYEIFNLANSEVYYSGVMPHVESIDVQNAYISTKNVRYVTLNVGRTTFATLDAFDYPDIINHPYFNFSIADEEPIFSVLRLFDDYEDDMQSKYLYREAEKANETNLPRRLKEMNDYLKHSFNTHTIAVSGNIVTKDGYLLIAKRSDKSIDAGTFYCSVNGQSEFLDENVEFYRKSVFEDLPTFNYDSKYRLDFQNEIERESIAEIGVSLFTRDWGYYGISFLGINNVNRNKDKIINRRMHFNILMFNRSFQDFEEILKQHLFVTEAFENKSIEGIKIRVYKNFRSRAFETFKHSINLLRGNMDIVAMTIVVLPIIFNIIIGLLNGGRVVNDIALFQTVSWGKGIQYAILLVYMILATAYIIKNIKLNKKRFTMHINYRNLSKVSDEITGFFSKKPLDKQRHHAILKVMLSCYYLQQKQEILGVPHGSAIGHSQRIYAKFGQGIMYCKKKLGRRKES